MASSSEVLKHLVSRWSDEFCRPRHAHDTTTHRAGGSVDWRIWESAVLLSCSSPYGGASVRTVKQREGRVRNRAVPGFESHSATGGRAFSLPAPTEARRNMRNFTNPLASFPAVLDCSVPRIASIGLFVIQFPFSMADVSTMVL